MKPDFEDNLNRYLRGQMCKEEQCDFENAVRNNVSLQQKVSEYINLLIAMKGEKVDIADIYELKSLCQKNLLTSKPEKKRYPTVRKIVIWFITALIIIALAFGLRYFFMNRAGERLYHEYYQSVPEEHLYTGNSNFDEYIHAMRYWQKGQEEEAVNELQKIVEKGKFHPYYEDACWYLALFYMKMREQNSAKDLLRRIINDGGYYSNKARTILDEIEESVR